MDTQVRLDKDSIDKNSIYIKDMYPETEVSEPPTPKKKTKTTRFIPPTVEEVRRYCQENKGAAGNGNDYAGPSASVKLW